MDDVERIQQLLIEAIGCYDRGDAAGATRLCNSVLLLDPDEPAALHLSGLVANDQGDPLRAVRFLEQAVRNGPDDADAWNDFGNVLQVCGRVQEALEAFAHAIRLAPNFADAHSNFGYMLFRQGEFEASLTHFHNALAIDPNFTLAANNLGSAHLKLRRFEEASAAFRFAIERDPQCADGYINLGEVLRRLDRHEEAINVLQRGLSITARPELLLNLGLVFKDLGQFADAQRCYESAISAKPSYAEAHWNLSLLLLARGELERGWEEFEWRRQVPGIAPELWPRDSREWTGQDVAGQTMLLIAEQGLGDTLQFVRYGAVLKAHGARVIAAVPTELLGILDGCDAVDQFVTLQPPFPPHDYFCFLMSLPRLLSPLTSRRALAPVGSLREKPPQTGASARRLIDAIPSRVPYLHAPERLLAVWHERLTGISGFKVGIGWQGNPNYAADQYRSIPLQYFETLARIPFVSLISLQRGSGTEQLIAAQRQFSVIDFGPELDSKNGRFMDTAAIVANLDLVISSDTALVHLAGGLGVPIWMPTSFVPDWRWLLDRPDSPWYPTLRLFRQRERQNWKSVFADLAAALASRVSGKENDQPRNTRK